jgi:hypothetical protein
MYQTGFETTISAFEQPQTHALDRAATETGHVLLRFVINSPTRNIFYRKNCSYTEQRGHSPALLQSRVSEPFLLIVPHGLRVQCRVALSLRIKLQVPFAAE